MGSTLKHTKQHKSIRRHQKPPTSSQPKDDTFHQGEASGPFLGNTRSLRAQNQILYLQRLCGNKAVQRMLGGSEIETETENIGTSTKKLSHKRRKESIPKPQLSDAVLEIIRTDPPRPLDVPEIENRYGVDAKQARQMAKEYWAYLEWYESVWGYYPWDRGKQPRKSEYVYEPDPKQVAQDQLEYARARRQLRRERMAENTVFGLDSKGQKHIEEALKAGYRIFDAAESYKNIELLAEALKSTGTARTRVKIIYKFHPGESKEIIIGKLRVVAELFGGYLDMVMLHDLEAPLEKIKQALDAIQTLKLAGVIRSLGVSNLKSNPEILELLKGYELKVVENPMSPKNPDDAIRQFCAERGIAYLAYELLSGVVTDRDFLEWVQKNASTYTASQLLFAWARFMGVIPVTSSSDRGRIWRNFEESAEPEVPVSVIKMVDAYWRERARRSAIPGEEVLGEIPEFVNRRLGPLLNLLKNLGGKNESTARMQYTDDKFIKRFLPGMLSDMKNFGLDPGPIRVPRNRGIDPSLWGRNLVDLITGLGTSNSCVTMKWIQAILVTLRHIGYLMENK